MRFYHTWPVLGMLLAGCANARVAPDSTADVRATMTRWQDALNRRSREQLMAVLSEDFRATGPGGRFGDRESYVAAHSEPRSGPAETCLLRDILVRPFGYTAVAHAVMACPGTTDAPPFQARTTNVLVREGLAWKITSYQATMLPMVPRGVDVAPEALAEMAGVYRTGAGRTWEFSVAAGVLRDGSGEGARPLVPLSPNTFVPANGSPVLTFLRDRRGVITAMEMSSPGDFIRYERVR